MAGSIESMTVRSAVLCLMISAMVVAALASLVAESTTTLAVDGPNPVVINEIHYNPAPGGVAFVELHNPSDVAIDLSGHDLDGMLTFPVDTSIDPQGYLVATANLAEFQVVYPGVAATEWAAEATLETRGERITLWDAAGGVVDSVRYDDGLGPLPLPTPIAVPVGPVQMGFHADQWGDDRIAYWGELEAVPGKGTLLAHEFKSFTKPLRMAVFEWHLNEGRDLLLTWNGTEAHTIVDGSNDDWIRHHAQELKTLPGTVKLRFWHEPDVSFKADWIDGDPQQFIDAWMYVRQIFVEEGAVDNIEWVWCPTAWNWEQQGALFYPGDENVDWICADGYSGMNLDAPLEPIASEFSAFQEWADLRPSKPILIAEFGATQREPADRAAWVEGIPPWVSASSNIRAVVYFDFDKRAEEPWDWRLRTEADAWSAMKDVLSSAPFGD